MTLFAHLFEDHAKYEFIRTLDSVLSVILQVTTLAVQIYGLHFIMTHSR